MWAVECVRIWLTAALLSSVLDGWMEVWWWRKWEKTENVRKKRRKERLLRCHPMPRKAVSQHRVGGLHLKNKAASEKGAWKKDRERKRGHTKHLLPPVWHTTGVTSRSRVKSSSSKNNQRKWKSYGDDREKEYEQRNKEDASGLEIYAFMLIHFKFSAITCCISMSCILGLSRVTQNIIFIQTRGSSVFCFLNKDKESQGNVPSAVYMQHLTQGQPFTDTQIKRNYKTKRTKHHFYLDLVAVPGSKFPSFPGWIENMWQATAGMINKKPLGCIWKSF